MFQRTRSTCLALIGSLCAGSLLPPVASGQSEVRNEPIMLTTQVADCQPAGPHETFTLPVEPPVEAAAGVPYSGVGTTEMITTLADGNRIVRTNTMRYYRDSRGRTRTEYSLAAVGPFTLDETRSVVMIMDPVAGRRYVLHPAFKRAELLTLGARSKGAPGVGTNSGAVAAVAIASSPPLLASTQGARASGVITTFGPMTATGAGPGGPNVFFVQRGVLASGPGGGCEPAVKPLPAPVSLGNRRIEGLDTTGSRLEFTIAAGEIGNEQPITVRSEQWFSPALGVVVLSTHHDPMIGDTTYRLEQISRAEPDTALFTVPADYTKQEIPGSAVAVPGIAVGQLPVTVPKFAIPAFAPQKQAGQPAGK